MIWNGKSEAEAYLHRQRIGKVCDYKPEGEMRLFPCNGIKCKIFWGETLQEKLL